MSEPELCSHFSTGETIPMELTSWEKHFFNSLSISKLGQLVNACHYLEFPHLYHYSCQVIASHLRNKSVKQMRYMFAIESAMHEEEDEKRLRERNEWNASTWRGPE